MTDLNKERELFVAFLKTKGILKIDWNCMGVITNIVREADCDLSYSDIELMQEVWMEKAKAQAVPESYVLLPRVPTEKMLSAGCSSISYGMTNEKNSERIYKAMVEASESGDKEKEKSHDRS
ncbi:hypothetical protein J503_1043 [Acinetobacter baumannii 984213]|nr:hypothetical protein [Acinetobacter baumannii]EXA69426.1 hypothetical protein J503_1043 [Acinetobacter baumannii 984213]MDN8238556.1 hypothetical protein [Acinetobacter baumannii]